MFKRTRFLPPGFSEEQESCDAPPCAPHKSHCEHPFKFPAPKIKYIIEPTVARAACHLVYTPDDMDVMRTNNDSLYTIY